MQPISEIIGFVSLGRPAAHESGSWRAAAPFARQRRLCIWIDLKGLQSNASALVADNVERDSRRRRRQSVQTRQFFDMQHATHAAGRLQRRGLSAAENEAHTRGQGS